MILYLHFLVSETLVALELICNYTYIYIYIYIYIYSWCCFESEDFVSTKTTLLCEPFLCETKDFWKKEAKQQRIDVHTDRLTQLYIYIQ